MTGKAPRDRRPVRIALAIVLAVMAVSAGTIHALWPREEPQPAPRTDIEAVLRAHQEFMETYLAGEFEDLWPLFAKQQKESLAQSKEWLARYYDPTLPITREELPRMEVRTFVEKGLVRYSAEKPEVRRREVEFLRSLEIRNVGTEGNRGWVEFGEADWSAVTGGAMSSPHMLQVTMGYWREDGEWKFQGCWLPALPFRTLDAKLEHFLLKDPRPWSFILNAVVEIGPEGLSEDGAKLLTARLLEVLEEPEIAGVFIDVAPTASWNSVVRAQDAVMRAGVTWIQLLASTTAGPGPGVRVNGIAEGVPWDPEKARIDPEIRERMMTVTWNPEHRPAEIQLDCPNRETAKGLGWVVETSFVNRARRPLRAYRMRDGDPTWRLLLLSRDESLARDRSPPPEPEPESESGEDDATIVASPDPDTIRVLVAAFGTEGDAVPERAARVELPPGERTSRLDVIPWRAGEWFLRAEVLDANGYWRPTNEVRLTTMEAAAEGWTAGAVRDLAVEPMGTSRRRWDWAEELEARGDGLASLLHRAGEEPEALSAFSRFASSEAEPSLRLLSALSARQLDPGTGATLLRLLAGTPDPALSEAANR